MFFSLITIILLWDTFKRVHKSMKDLLERNMDSNPILAYERRAYELGYPTMHLYHY